MKIVKRVVYDVYTSDFADPITGFHTKRDAEEFVRQYKQHKEVKDL